MLTLCDINPDDITEFFCRDPRLCYLGLPDNDLVTLYEQKRYIPSDNSVYKGVCNDDGRLVCVVKWEWFILNNTINLHFYVSSDLQGKNVSTDIGVLLREYFTNETCTNKVIIMVPSPCVHVQKFAVKSGLIQEGRITKAMRWRNEIVDILIFGTEIVRNQEV